MTYRDAEDASARPPRPKSADGGYESDEDFLRGDDKPREKRRRSAAGSFMRILLILIILVAAIAGGLYAAIHFRLVDPAEVGLDGLLGAGTGAAPSRPTTPTIQADVIFAGDSTQLATAPGNSVQPDESADIAWIRSTVKAASASGATDGVTVLIPRELLPRLEGRRARITISARSGSEGDPVPFAAAYSAGPKGNSNWVVFVPEKRFSDHSFSFVVPIGDLAGSDDHRVAIWSDIEGRGVPLGIRSITIQPD